MIRLSLFAVVLASSAALAVPQIQKIKDINQQILGHDSMPHGFVEIGALTYFVADHPSFGAELWRTDGTAAGTVQVKDIRPGTTGSNPRGLVALGTTLFFAADDGINGIELWKSDGTSSGTVLVKDINPGSVGSNVQELVVWGTFVYFVASEPGAGTEIWRSDGTDAGTTLAIDVVPGSGSSNPWELEVSGTRLFFSAFRSDLGRELWAWDGTTLTVIDIRTGTGSSEPREVTALGTSVLFSADDGSTGRELWRSDGTTTGTVRVMDICAPTCSSFPSGLTAWSGRVYFSANNGAAGVELWSSDGTTATLVRDIDPTGSSSPFNLTAAPTALYFSATDGASGHELWRTDGTSAGTVLVKDIRAGALGSFPSNLRWSGTRLFFSADEAGSVGRELWGSDGTAAGTTRIADIWPGMNSGLASFYAVGGSGGALLFAAKTAPLGVELWKSDGTTAGTTLVRDIHPGTYPASSAPVLLRTIGATTYLAADDGLSGRELWRTDGTSAGTVRVKDLIPGEAGSFFGESAELDGALIFAAGAAGTELWRSDGTDAGTSLLASVGTDPRSFVRFGGALYFTAGGTVCDLWRTNGTASGTMAVKRLGTTSCSATVAGETLFYIFVGSKQIWRSRGGAADTVLLESVPGFINLTPRAATLGDQVFFAYDDGTSGEELWKRDPEAGSRELVRDIHPGPGGSRLRDFTVAGGRLFFVASNTSSPSNLELWITDGTTANTLLVRDINPAGSSIPEDLTAVGNLVFFTANAADGSGREVWRSDGTTTGTFLPRDVHPAPNISSAPGHLTAFGSYLLFWADSETAGRQLWMSGGEAATTHPRAALGPVGFPGFSERLTIGATQVLFPARDASAQFEEELWGFARDLSPPVVTPTVTGTPGANGWWVSDVGVQFAVTEPESTAFLFTSGCGPRSFTTDTAGERVVCSATSEGGPRTVTIDIRRDASPPLLSCPTAVPSREAESLQGAVVGFPEPTASDLTSGLGGPVTYTPRGPGNPFPVGNTTVTATATNGAGLRTSCTIAITVTDTTPPTIRSCPDREVAATSPEGAPVDLTGSVPVDDRADPAPVVQFQRQDGQPLDALYPIGSTRVEAVAVDFSGNRSAPCAFSVNVLPHEGDGGGRRMASHYSWSCSATGQAPSGVALVLLVLWALRRQAARTTRAAGLLAAVLVLASAPAQAAEATRTKLAFVGINASPGVSATEAKAISQSLESEVSALGLYEVISADSIAALLGLERQKQLLGCADEAASCIAELAGALDVDRLLSGDLGRVGETVILNVSLLDARNGKLLARASRQARSASSLEPLLEQLRPVVYELANADPRRGGRTFQVERGFGGLVVGLRGDADMFAPGLNLAPALYAELSGRQLGGAIAVFAKNAPGFRLEGRYYPVELNNVRPYLAGGATAFATGIGARAAVGVDVRFGRLRVFLDVAYERYLVTFRPSFFPNAGLVGLGAAWAL